VIPYGRWHPVARRGLYSALTLFSFDDVSWAMGVASDLYRVSTTLYRVSTTPGTTGNLLEFVNLGKTWQATRAGE